MNFCNVSIKTSRGLSRFLVPPVTITRSLYGAVLINRRYKLHGLIELVKKYDRYLKRSIHGIGSPTWEDSTFYLKAGSPHFFEIASTTLCYYKRVIIQSSTFTAILPSIFVSTAFWYHPLDLYNVSKVSRGEEFNFLLESGFFPLSKIARTVFYGNMSRNYSKLRVHLLHSFSPLSK